jgi:hypothetical protein
MSKRNQPQPFGIEEINLRSCFTAPSLRHFALLIVGWVLTIERHTISRILLTLGLHQTEHYSNIYRFISRANWGIDAVAQRLFRWMIDALQSPGQEILVVLDDTLNKHTGRKICGAGWQYDGSARNGQTHDHGICLVTVGLAITLPEVNGRVFCLPYAARLWFPHVANIKPTGQPYKSKPELGLELIMLTHSWLKKDEKLRVVADISYSCRTIISNKPKEVHFTGRMRIDSALYEVPEPRIKTCKGRPRTKGDRLPTPQEMFNNKDLPWENTTILLYGKKAPVTIYHFYAVWPYSAGRAVLSILLCRDPKGIRPDTVFFDTDCTAPKQTILQRYSARWSIEITNRETKHLLGTADPQCRSQKAVIRAPLIGLWAYSFVVLWFIKNFRAGRLSLPDPSPWYQRKTNITFSDMLAMARRSHFVLRFSTKAWKTSDFVEMSLTRPPRVSIFSKKAKL